MNIRRQGTTPGTNVDGVYCNKGDRAQRGGSLIAVFLLGISTFVRF